MCRSIWRLWRSAVQYPIEKISNSIDHKILWRTFNGQGWVLSLIACDVSRTPELLVCGESSLSKGIQNLVRYRFTSLDRVRTLLVHLPLDRPLGDFPDGFQVGEIVGWAK